MLTGKIVGMGVGGASLSLGGAGINKARGISSTVDLEILLTSGVIAYGF